MLRTLALAQPIRLNEPLLWIWKTPNAAGALQLAATLEPRPGSPRIEPFSFVFAI